METALVLTSGIHFPTTLNVHHACLDKGSVAYAKIHAPFKSVNNPIPFLSCGYYFWQESLEYARDWAFGRNKTKDIFVFNGELDPGFGTDMLDLLRPEFREHLLILVDLMKEESDKEEVWTLSKAIHVLREAHKLRGFFPFKMVRARDNLSKGKSIRHYFSVSKQNYMDFFYGGHIICIFETPHTYLKSFNIVYPEQ